MNRILLSSALVLVSSAALPALATDILVPTQQPTIQAGINAAVGGDVVLVLPGVYTGSGNKNLDFGGKAITVRRADNSGPCTIDCQGSGRGFFFHSSETPAAVVEGITITNGFSGGMTGGGILCQGSSPTFRNCIIRNNVSFTDGGGVAIASPGTSSPLFANCHFLSNHANDDGGAVVLGAPIGPGTAAVFVNCLFSQNSANDRGGAVLISAGPGMQPRFINCSFSNNEASDGGAFYREGGGGDVFAHVRNSILWNDLPNEIAGALNGFNVMYTIIEGGFFPGPGILDADPLFIDADGADNTAGTVDDDLRVAAGSPAIDAAENSAVPAGTTADLAGAARFSDDPDTTDTGQGTVPIVDIGAYEHPPCSLDVTGDSVVGFAEVTELLLHWGPCPAGPCAWDSNGDGTVGFADFTQTLLDWGPCT